LLFATAVNRSGYPDQDVNRQTGGGAEAGEVLLAGSASEQAEDGGLDTGGDAKE